MRCRFGRGSLTLINYLEIEIHIRRDFDGTDIELGDVDFNDSETKIAVQPITTRKLNHQFSTTETTGKLGNSRQVSTWNQPGDI